MVYMNKKYTKFMLTNGREEGNESRLSSGHDLYSQCFKFMSSSGETISDDIISPDENKSQNIEKYRS